MKTLTITYPEDLELTLDSNAEHFAEEARMLLAYKLFELRRLTSGQAARLACISRVQFLLQSKTYGVPSVAWDREELAAEAFAIS